MHRLRRAVYISTLALGLLGAASLGEWVSLATWELAPLPAVGPELRFLERGWDCRRVLRLDHEVTALAQFANNPRQTLVYAGTDDSGDVYQFESLFGDEAAPVPCLVARGLGDRIQTGTCAVNTLAMHDLDGDGVPELLASTCQILPMSRPRMYVWSLYPGSSPILRGMARPAIASSWSHGLGLVTSADGRETGLLGTFCGHGEIVEYRLMTGAADSDLQFDAVGWRVVGQLPASGEETVTADIDNDGRSEVCLAVGFATGKAAIHVYAGDTLGSAPDLKRVIDEGGRFANVRFLIGDTRAQGANDVVACWITSHTGGGDVEIIRYRLGPEGVRERTVLGRGDSTFWPSDGQLALHDSDEDGYPEVWMATGSGNLWRYADRTSAGWTNVAHFEHALGPILGIPRWGSQNPPMLLAGYGREIVRLRARTP